MNKSIQDMTTWCPKHGVAHGVCIDPIRVTDSQKPNRFDPYEALDDILQRMGELVTDYISGGCRNTDEIGNQVHALRAYITGMER